MPQGHPDLPGPVVRSGCIWKRWVKVRGGGSGAEWGRCALGVKCPNPTLTHIFSGSEKFGFSVTYSSLAGSKGFASGSLLKACPQNSVLMSLPFGPCCDDEWMGWFPGQQNCGAGNRSAFGGAFASGNSTRVTELQAGAHGD